MNKSEKSDHPHQREPWCFVEVVNKVSVRDKTSSPQHSRCSYASGALIRIYFHPETAEKIAPHCMVRLDLDNCRPKISILEIFEDICPTFSGCTPYLNTYFNLPNIQILKIFKDFSNVPGCISILQIFQDIFKYFKISVNVSRYL